MRPNVKGGVWRNTEDEILKLAVMKYGPHQWARISSLLTRKSPAQCKARWFEWLDPSIKKTEWSKEEEEKLLHLAKIFPSQWKTIAPLVGRTAAQCLEHYNRLLDEVQRQQSGSGADAAGGEDPRRLRFGEVEPIPETKPAKPDPIDMDEEEKETLSEAKARLSNTMGKKEKRKFREKQLEEARRLAALQKKRELKAAGIHYNPKTKNAKDFRDFDISKEIPFFQKPKAGFYEVPEEELRDDPNRDLAFIGKRLDQIENPNYLQRQDKLNKIEDIKRKKKEMMSLPDSIFDLSKKNDVDQTLKRSKLSLPSPQLTEQDIQEIAEYEKANDVTGGQQGVTNALVGKFPVPANRTVARTPLREDVIMMEAQNLLNLSNAETPLKGGNNPSVTPLPVRSSVPTSSSQSSASATGATPNPLAVHLTPARKQQQQQLDEYSREDKFKKQQNKNQLLSKLKTLPSPSQSYKLALPDEPMDDMDASASDATELDQSEHHIREQQQLKHKEQFRLRTRSTVLKRNLPRSQNYLHIAQGSDSIHIDETSSVPIQTQIQNILASEINRIILHDNLTFPLALDARAQDDASYQHFSNTELEHADHLLRLEMAQMASEQPLDAHALLSQMDAMRAQYIYLPSQAKHLAISSLTPTQLIDALAHQHTDLIHQIKSSSSKSVHLEKKLNIYNGGYHNRCSALLKDIDSLYSAYEKANIELECFDQLAATESVHMDKRLADIQNQVYDQCEIESRLQAKYAALKNELSSLKSTNNNHNHNNHHNK
ncbi:hypothetical protein CYY_009414 [Polysphondylium violaceum]|uniref:Myb domain-containing protein n=1 Tax=Polysphondylium violaceum TaxID=133409 RepID=A0A8J4UW24_9MYCE|nr:hypothetical protein CYY_009414 [Polysphondylium violaceum]